MKTNRIMTTALAVILIAGLTGCEKKEERGVERIKGLDTVTPASMPGPDPENINNQAPPLSELTGAPHSHDGPHDHANDSMTSGSTDASMIQAGQTKVMAGGNILQVAGLAFTVSDSWKNVKPDNAIRVAEYELEGSGGPAQMAVFYFGKNQGGGIEDNVRRWAAQFTSDATTTGTGEAQVARMEKDKLHIALVKTEGTYDPGSMAPAMAASGKKENYALFGLVVADGPEGSVFIKVTGPKATVAEQNEALEKMAQSVRVSEYK